MYIPLNNKTNYTLLSSLLKVDDLLSYAEKNKLDSICIIDRNMYSTMEFIKKCNSKNIKPIIGLELVLDDFIIDVIAKNYEGYKNLIKLTTIQSERTITVEDIKKYKSNLICIIPYIYNSKYNELSKIYENTYIGYSNKKEELEVFLIKNYILMILIY